MQSLNSVKQPIIAFLSDFNTTDPYVGIVKGVIAGINPDAKIIDITHGIPAQDIFAGALMLSASFSYFPKGTIFLAVVDPGVGSERKAVVAETSDYLFVLPDNGLATGVHRTISSSGSRLQYRYIENSSLFLENQGNTFHARDIFGPVAAHLSRGIKMEETGPPCQRPVLLDWPEAKIKDGHIEGRVIYTDSFGNLITNIEEEAVNKMGGRLYASAGTASDIPVLPTYSAARPGELLCVAGSFGLMEIAVNQGSAKERLNLSAGSKVSILQERS